MSNIMRKTRIAFAKDRRRNLLVSEEDASKAHKYIVGYAERQHDAMKQLRPIVEEEHEAILGTVDALMVLDNQQVEFAGALGEAWDLYAERIEEVLTMRKQISSEEEVLRALHDKMTKADDRLSRNTKPEKTGHLRDIRNEARQAYESQLSVTGRQREQGATGIKELLRRSIEDVVTASEIYAERVRFLKNDAHACTIHNDLTVSLPAMHVVLSFTHRTILHRFHNV